MCVFRLRCVYLTVNYFSLYSLIYFLFFNVIFVFVFCTLVQAQNKSYILRVSREFLCKVRNHLLNRDQAVNKFRARLDVESTLNRRHVCQCYTDIKGQIKTEKKMWLTKSVSCYLEIPVRQGCLLDNLSRNFEKSLIFVVCLVCITCSKALDVSNFRLTGDSLCGHPACSLRQWGCSGEGAQTPVNYQLINSGSFLLVLVSACKRLLVCGIGGSHCDYGIRKK